jgi:cation diffusion facilitator family transporter
MPNYDQDEGMPILAGLLPIRRNRSVVQLLETRQEAPTSSLRAPLNPENRAIQLLQNTKERIDWDSYLRPEEEISQIKNKHLRRFYQEQNEKIENFKHVDSILDSSLPGNVIRSYGATDRGMSTGADADAEAGFETEEAEQRAISRAINVNFAANVILLLGKIVVTLSTESLSIIASLLDSVLDFLSTVIVWTSNKLAQRRDNFKYPVGRSRLEPLGVLVFSVLMIVSFFQVAIQGVQQLMARPETRSPLKPLSPSVVIIMASVVLVKSLCWFWCRSSKSASVQALAQDAASDVVFNFFSIVFPLLGFYFDVWWLDPLGAVLISIYILISWTKTSSEHIMNLTGRIADVADIEAVIYMAMRFSDLIQGVTSVAAYHAGDKVVVELDILLDEQTSLRDSHDLGEALQYAIEHIGSVERAFCHQDYVATKTSMHKATGGFK